MDSIESKKEINELNSNCEWLRVALCLIVSLKIENRFNSNAIW